MSQEESQYATTSSDATPGKGQRSRLACLRCRTKKTVSAYVKQTLTATGLI